MKAKHHQKDDQRKVEEKQSNDNISKAIVRSFFEWSDGMRVIRQGNDPRRNSLTPYRKRPVSVRRLGINLSQIHCWRL